MRRFSDGAASIQAFKAQLEKMGNHSSIKQLQQVEVRARENQPGHFARATPGWMASWAADPQGCLWRPEGGVFHWSLFSPLGPESFVVPGGLVLGTPSFFPEELPVFGSGSLVRMVIAGPGPSAKEAAGSFSGLPALAGSSEGACGEGWERV